MKSDLPLISFNQSVCSHATEGLHMRERIHTVLLTHLDCDHANGLPQVKSAKKFLVSADELKFASKMTNRVRYYKGWWKDIPLTRFDWNDTQGSVGKSYDLLGDGSIELINIPGYADGLFAVKIKNEEGKFVLLFRNHPLRCSRSCVRSR